MNRLLNRADEKLRAALRFGADAVYLAGKRFGMRSAAIERSILRLPKTTTVFIVRSSLLAASQKIINN